MLTYVKSLSAEQRKLGPSYFCRIGDESGKFCTRRSRKPRWTNKFSSCNPALKHRSNNPGSGVTREEVRASLESSFGNFLVKKARAPCLLA